MLAAGAIVSGKYAIEKVIGSGGMGTVYRAKHVSTMKLVALKVLNPALTLDDQAVARFRREAKAAALIAHPGICDVYDIDETEEGTPYMVMEYLEGETLHDRLDRDGTIAAHEAVLLVTEVLDALAAAHTAGIIHRDLKPGNIFITRQGRTKVLDFGILKFAEYLAETAITKTGMSMGTPLYMAPEQMRDSRTANQEADLYAMGAILYRCLAGAPPFHATVYAQVIVKTLTEPHKPLIQVVPDCPEALSAVLDRLLAKNPTLRPHTAEATRDLLLEAIGLLQATPDPPTKPTKIRRDPG